MRDLSLKASQPLTLGDVPDAEFEHWGSLGLSHIWLMGVWITGPRSRALSLRAYRKFPEPPNISPNDVWGSPYAIGQYEVSPALGGNEGLLQFRAKLHSCGMKLFLDFVPNHLGLDHPWLVEKPELFVQSPSNVPGTFLQGTNFGPRWMAHGRDPFFPPWVDTAQLDYRHPQTHQLMRDVLHKVSTRCDGVRCDMAMLVLNEVFHKTWATYPSPELVEHREFWPDAIGSVKSSSPDFLFLAEAYWDLEPRLQSLGFDYTYDKTVYDLLLARRPHVLQNRLLQASPQYLQGSVHFLENHDEARIASLLPLPEHRAAVLLTLGLPGMRMLHEGQLTGATTRQRIHLAYRPPEPTQPEIASLYESILTACRTSAVGHGHPTLLQPQPAWPGNPTASNFVLVQWQAVPGEVDLVVVNLAPHQSQCYARPTLANLDKHTWLMQDLLGAGAYDRDGLELQNRGLYLDVPAHAAHVFHFQPM